MSVHVNVNLASCEGHGLCQQAAPEVYELDEEGYVRLRHDEIDESLRAAAETGARVCPVAALSVQR